MESALAQKYKSATGIYLKDISAPIADEMKLFRRAFKEAMRTDVFLVNRVSGYMVSRQGKKMRPMLVLLCAKACGEPNEDSISAAVLIELLHAATLVHDDVVDWSEERRGIPSISSIWRNKISILMGDFLFSRALIHMIKLRSFKALGVLSSTAERMSRGELLQMEKSRSHGIDEDTYFRMISDKTASLFSAACHLGVLTTTESLEKQRAMTEFGEYLGVAFQLKDDLFDFVGRKKTIGKPGGGDVKENLITLPLIHALSNGSRRQAREMIKVLRREKKNEEFKKVIDFVTQQGGLEYADEKLREYSDMAISSLSAIDDGPVKDSLVNFVFFNANRNK